MNRRKLRVLLLQARVEDAELIQVELDRMNIAVVVKHVDTKHAFADALQEFAPQVIISDHSLAQFNSVSALQMVQAKRPTAPFIVVTGAPETRALVASMRAGAEDVLLRSDLDRLGPAIEAAMSVREPLRTLTPRQLQIFQLVASGYTTPAIAERLNLSGKTVETHRGELMKRLEIHDLARLVRYAVRVGIVPPGEFS